MMSFSRNRQSCRYLTNRQILAATVPTAPAIPAAPIPKYPAPSAARGAARPPVAATTAIPAAAPKIAPFLPWKETLLSMLLTFLNGLFAPPCKLTELIEPTTN